ncbi:hypothetical protein I552_7038 [Mycobacterium xenopi 3993]|nr:hypothetical protein I552_7038 [Mycobacterium xenopi 3993]
MNDELRSAAAPRWRGQPGRLEVWYATLSDPVTRAGLWLHHEIVAPTSGSPYGHGWATWFPADGAPRTERFGPEPVEPVAGPAWFDASRVRAAFEELSGQAGSLTWQLHWKDTGAPLWTFPRLAWERELLPGAQVVLAPTAQFTGSLTVADAGHRLDGWRGGWPTSTGAATPNVGGGCTLISVTATWSRSSPRYRTHRDCKGWRRWRSSGSASTERIGRQAVCRRCGCERRWACGIGSWRAASADAMCSSGWINRKAVA